MSVRQLFEETVSQVISALWTGDSSFDPGGPYGAWDWSTAERLVGRLQQSSSFQDSVCSITHLLAGAPRAEIVLTAELTYLLLLPSVEYPADRKKVLVEEMLTLIPGERLTLPPAMSAVFYVLDDPLFNEMDELLGLRADDVPFCARLLWLLRFVAGRGRPCAECQWIDLNDWLDDHCKHDSCCWETALEDSSAFYEYACGIEDDCPSARHYMAYLMWPQRYVAVVDPRHREEIRTIFAGQIGGISGYDELSIARDLMLIRKAHEVQGLGPVNWYSQPYRSQW